MPTSNNNPYAPSSQLLAPTPAKNFSLIAPIHARYVFTSQHFTQTMSRYRSQSLIHWVWRAIRVPAAILFFVTASLSLWIAFNNRQIGPMLPITTFLFLLVAITLLTGSIGNYFALFSLRRDPSFGKTIHLTIDHQGLHLAYEGTDQLYPWSFIRRTRTFRDGVLFLVRSQQLMIWVPDTSLEAPEQRTTLHDLTKHLIQLQSPPPTQFA